MAELVDALVSNTNEVTLVPVRLRLRVRLYIKASQMDICEALLLLEGDRGGGIFIIDIILK